MVFTVEELRDQISNSYEYPPLACRLERLLGADFSRLQTRGGYYPGADEDGNADDGFVYHGFTCPQQGCDEGFVWVHPDGRMLALIEDGRLDDKQPPVEQVRVDVYANDPDLRTRPPRLVARELTTFERSDPWERRVSFVWHLPPTWTQHDWFWSSPAVARRRDRYVAAAAGRLCDEEFSSFGAPAMVLPSVARTYFHDQPTAASRRRSYAVSGDLVRLAASKEERFLCAEYVGLDKRRTVGWLRADDAQEVASADDELSPTALATQVAGLQGMPAWWGPHEQRFGAMSVQVVKGGARIALSRGMAGHVCGVVGLLRPTTHRVFSTDSDEEYACAATLLVFENGVYLLASSQCGGARANCSGAYLP